MQDVDVRALLAISRSRPSLVAADASLEQVIAKLIEDQTTREVYVVDADQRYFGVITLRRLAHVVFLHEHPDTSSATSMLELISVENAGDICLQKPAYVREADSLEQSLRVMFTFDINEIAVIDDAHRIVGSLTMMEIIRAWHEGWFDDL